MSGVSEDDDLLAAEYALGLLSPQEALAAEARLKIDAPLSLRVAWWRDQLSLLAVETETEPAAHVWQASLWESMSRRGQAGRSAGEGSCRVRPAFVRLDLDGRRAASFEAT